MSRRSAATGWPWFDLGMQMTLLTIEAQQVIAMRLAMLALGGPGVGRESIRMVTEKVQAAMECQRLMMLGAGTDKPGLQAQSVVGLYRRRVGANLRRLSKA